MTATGPTFTSAARPAPEWTVSPDDVPARPRPLTSRASQFTWAADRARYAPSVFNTQPWRWRVTDSTLELYADPTRILGAVDPDARLLTISCGVALHHARVALTAGGDEVRVQYLPEPDRPELLARLSVLGPYTPGPRDTARFTAIQHRRTDRRPFSGQPVAPSLLARLRGAAESMGVQLHVLRPEEVTVLASAAAHAADVESGEPAYREQLDEWTNRPSWTADGVAAASVAGSAGRRVPIRAFHLGADEAAPAGSDQHAEYAILWGDGDDTAAWLRAGEALSAIMLDATVAGLALSPMSDLVEVESARETLRRLISHLGQPYLVLRIGHPQPGPAAASPRRPAHVVIEED